MNIKRSITHLALTLAPAAFAVCALEAQDQSQPPIVGSWTTTVLPVPNGPQFAPFPGLITIHADGTLIESDGSNVALSLPPPNPFCNCTLVALDQGHGVWKKAGDGKYQIKFVQIAASADDSTLVFTNTLQFTVDVSGNGNSQFQGTGSFQITDAHGMPIQGFSGPEQIMAQRISISAGAGGAGNVSIVVNGAPGVFANGANTFQVTTNLFGLDASHSTSTNSGPLTYSWAVMPSGSAGISYGSTATPVIQLVNKGTFQLSVTVTDTKGVSATQAITIQYV